MRRLIVGLAVAAALLFAGCGVRNPFSVDVPCVETCKDLKPKLINNLGIPESRINCEDPMWREANTCAKCKQLIRTLYEIQPEGCPGF